MAIVPLTAIRFRGKDNGPNFTVAVCAFFEPIEKFAGSPSVINTSNRREQLPS